MKSHLILEHELDIDLDTTVLLRVWVAVSPGLVEIVAVTFDGFLWDAALPADARESIYALAIESAAEGDYQHDEWNAVELAALRPAAVAKGANDAAA
mgnify:CR=1 FL=1